MAITVNFPEIGESATYEDGTPQEQIAADFQRRKFRAGYRQNPISSIVGLVEHITSRPTAPKPATVSGSSVIGLAPDQTNALLDRVQRTNEVEQQAYQNQIDRAARQQEAERQRQFYMQQNMQQQEYQTQRDTQADKKEEQRRLEGTVKSDGMGGYEWIRPDPATGKPMIERLKAGDTQWKTINLPDGGISQIEVDPSGRMIGQPQTVVAGQEDDVRLQQISEYNTPDGKRIVNLLNPKTGEVTQKELPQEAPKVSSTGNRIKWANGMPYYESVDPATGAPIPVPIEVPPALQKQIDESGFDKADFLRTMMNYAADNGLDLGDQVDADAAVAATKDILGRASAATGTQQPATQPPAAGGGIFVGENGKRYRDLGNGMAEEL